MVESSRPVATVAREQGVHEQTVRNWVSDYRKVHATEEPPLALSERARLRELEKEVRELRLEKEFLGKATAFFAKRPAARRLSLSRPLCKKIGWGWWFLRC